MCPVADSSLLSSSPPLMSLGTGTAMAAHGLSSPERGRSIADRSLLERRSNAVPRSQGRGVEEDPIGSSGDDDRCLLGHGAAAAPASGGAAGKGGGRCSGYAGGRSCNGDGWALQAAVKGWVRQQ
ncbi:hypothetical protein ACP70R_046895 [Stipagrostis hirtigluma subsp. patula]